MVIMMVNSVIYDKQLEELRESKMIKRVLDDDLMFFIMYFVEEYCDDIFSDFVQKERGRPRIPLKNILALILYSYCKKTFSPRVIGENTRVNIPSMILMEGMEVSGRSVSRYRFLLTCYYKVILSKTLQLALDLGLTTYDHVAFDGTIIKAYNSSFNVIRKVDVKRLLHILEEDDYDEKIIKKLRKPAYDLLYDDMKLELKIDFLYHLLEELEISEQKTCPLYDNEARWMFNKKKNKELSYNLQSAVDYTSKLILAVHVSQHPTDQYQLPPTLTKAIENTPVKLNNISADTAYHNEVSNKAIQENNLDGYIPTRKQAKKAKKKENPDLFHKDNMIEIEGTDTFLCFNNEFLYLKYEYPVKNKNRKNKDDPTEVKRMYNNPEACYECPYKKLCFSESHTHRQITEYGSEEVQEMKFKLETHEGKKEYEKRGKTVEAPYGTLKQQYHINQLPFINTQHVENIINLYSTAYNINRIFEIIHITIDENDKYQKFKEEKIQYYKKES